MIMVGLITPKGDFGTQKISFHYTDGVCPCVSVSEMYLFNLLAHTDTHQGASAAGLVAVKCRNG